MCLCHLSFFSRRGGTHPSNDCDSFSTLAHKNSIRPWSKSPPQEIITSLWQLPQYGYDLESDSQETLRSKSSNSSASSVSALYGDESSTISSSDEGSICPQDAIELEDSTDSGSIISCTSSTRATRGSSRATSPLTSDGVSHHAIHNMNTLQRHRVACQNHKPAKSPASYPVLSSGSPTHRLTKKGMSKNFPYSSTASPLGHGKIYPSSLFHEVADSAVHASANGQLDEARSCCIRVLSSFEERYLSRRTSRQSCAEVAMGSVALSFPLSQMDQETTRATRQTAARVRLV
jgi:hypothetical protein